MHARQTTAAVRRSALTVFLALGSSALHVPPATAQSQPALDRRLDDLKQAVYASGPRLPFRHAVEVAKLKDPRAIPTLIGLIDADNSYDTVYGIGYFALTPLTGVAYDDLHHGPWWRKWWEVKKSGLPPDVQALPIPDLPKTAKGKEFAAKPVDPLTLVLEPTLDDLLKRLIRQVQGDLPGDMSLTATAIADRKDSRAIPTLIGVIDADNSYDTIYGVGYFGLESLTGVAYDDLHHGPWWRKWWEVKKSGFQPDVQASPIPNLPKTAKGKEFAAKPIDPLTLIVDPTLDDLLQRLAKQVHGDLPGKIRTTAQAIAKLRDPRAIPTLIGLIESDNTDDTVCGIGYIALGQLTGVADDDLHHGPWWRKWWEVKKSGFPPDVQALPIPDLPKTAKGKEFAAKPVDPLTLILEPTLDDLLKRLIRQVQGDLPGAVSLTAIAIADRKDSRAIPTLIGLIDADNSYETVYGIGYFALTPLTGVAYDEKHDGAWWRQWWNEHRDEYSGADRSIPKFPQADRKPAAAAADVDDVADVPAQDLRIADDANRRYFLIGPAAGQAVPQSGYRLLIVLPGGDGSADFHPFVKRIFKYALPEGYLVAQAVAPRWSDDSHRIVWPTTKARDAAMKFPTEEFIESIVAHLKKRHPLDDRCVFALGWSSGGPPVYAAAMQEKTALTGAFVAMSVFHPNALPPPAPARGRAFYLLHSPQDFIKMSFPENARDTLKQAGAAVELKMYEGGHGWRGDVFGEIRAGVQWLEKQQK